MADPIIKNMTAFPTLFLLPGVLSKIQQDNQHCLSENHFDCLSMVISYLKFLCKEENRAVLERLEIEYERASHATIQ